MTDHAQSTPLPTTAPNPFSEPERAQAHLAAVVASSEDAIISKTLEGIVTSWNTAAERLFGYRADEMVGRSILTIIPEELRYEEVEILKRLRAGSRVDRYETIRLHKNGQRLEISLTISPVLDAAGNVVGAAKIAHDVTERRRLDRALAEEAKALETLNRVGQAVAAQLDIEALVQLVTDSATQLTGAAFGAFFYNVSRDQSDWLYTLSGVSREKFAEFPLPRNTALFRPTFEGEEVVRSDDILKDPRYGHNAPHKGIPAGHLPVRSYLAVPVTLHTREVTGRLFCGHPEPGMFTERSERLVLGIAAQASIAMANARLFQSVREREEQLEQGAREREKLLESERVARSDAERLSHLKDEFLATLSHELRTPLNAIQGWAMLLRKKNMTAAERERGLETIERNIRTQSKIVNDLLDMNRIVSGKFHLEIQPIQLQDVISSAIESVRQTAESKNIRIQRLIDSTIGWMRGDPNRLQQVLWNLLSNAVKFTPAGGRIRVILERVNSHAEIVVEDSGIGIKADFLPFVFDRFRQGDATITRRHGGLGLGLSIVRNLVELHGGSVRVKSAGENQGATFVVTLPISHVRADVGPQLSVPRTEVTELDSMELPRLDGVSVLIVDDQPDGLELVARILENLGAQPTCAGSAGEALRFLERQQFDILLSDIGMPDTDGYEFLRHARALSDAQRTRPMPAIAVTAYARSEDRQRSLLAGYQMHLSKPMDTRELAAGIASLLRVSR